MALTLANIEAFCAVIETGGVNAAARRLSLSRSVVSKRVTDLEAAIGSTLLHRSTSQTVPTEAGEAFYARTATMLRELEDAADEARGGDGVLAGHLRVSVPVDATAAFLQVPLLEFARQHPGLKMAVDLDDRVVDLTAGAYDVAIRIGRLGDSALRARRLCNSPRLLAAAPSYLEQYGMPQSLDDVPTHATIGYANAPVSQVWRFEDSDGTECTVRVAPRLTFNNGTMMRAAAVAGLGIIILPEFLLADDLTAGRLRVIELPQRPVPDGVHAVYSSPSGQPPRKTRLFIDHMAEALSRARK